MYDHPISTAPRPVADPARVVPALVVASLFGAAALVWSFKGIALAGVIVGISAGWTASRAPIRPWRTLIALAIVAAALGALAAAWTGSTADWTPGFTGIAIGAVAGAISPTVPTFLVVVLPSMVLWPLGVTILPGYLAGALIALAVRYAPTRGSGWRVDRATDPR